MASVAFHLLPAVSLVLTVIVPLVAQQGTNKAIFTPYIIQETHYKVTSR